LYRPLAEKRLQRGIRLLSTAEVVVTDRLHGHILCLLLGIPHVLLDTSNGKLSAFHRTWTRAIPGVEFAQDWEDARSQVRSLVEGRSRPQNANAAESPQRRPS
jgi:pyruvyl transferase EpsO